MQEVYQLDGVTIKVDSFHAQVSMFDEQSQSWKPMNRLSGGYNSNKRPLVVDECNTISKKRTKYSFDMLPTELIIEILSFGEYYIPLLPLNHAKFFGRFRDGSIHPLYYNIELNVVRVLNESNVHLHYILKRARKLNCIGTIKANLLISIYRNAKSLKDIYLQYVDSGPVETEMEERLYPICSKVRAINISDRHDMLLLPHLTETKYIFIEDCAKCKVIFNVLSGRVIGELPSKSISIEIRSQKECDMLVSEINRNKHIEHLDIMDTSEDGRNWQFPEEFLRNVKLKSLLCGLSHREIEQLSHNAYIENIELSVVDKEILTSLKRMKLNLVRYLVQNEENYSEQLTLLNQTSAKQVILWKSESEDFIPDSMLPVIRNSPIAFTIIYREADRIETIKHVLKL